MDPKGGPRTVVVKTFADEIAAEMAASFLREEGIETVFLRDDPGRMGIRRSAKLRVLSPDLERARELLDAMDRENDQQRG